MNHDRWLPGDEIAEYLGIKPDTVYKWIAEKGMPAHRIGRPCKCRKTDVDHWVRSGAADTLVPVNEKPKARKRDL